MQLENIGWHWRKLYAPPQVMRKKNHLTTIQSVTVVAPGPAGDVTKYPRHPVVLMTGDGACMPEDVKTFEAWDIPHDLYCINRSMLYFERQVDHWAAVDIEESGWFAENVNFKVEPERHIMRHTIGDGSFAYDVYWKMDIEEEDNTFKRRVLVGNTGYFGILTAIAMGYEKIVIAGMPLNKAEEFAQNGSSRSGEFGKQLVALPCLSVICKCPQRRQDEAWQQQSEVQKRPAY